MKRHCPAAPNKHHEQTRQLVRGDFAPGAQFSSATWRIMVYNLLHHRLQPVFVFGRLHENITWATKLEVHNILHSHQRRTEPQPQITCTETCGFWDMQADSQTYKHIEMLIAILQPIPLEKKSTNWLIELKLCITRDRMGHFGNVLPSQKKPNLT